MMSDNQFKMYETFKLHHKIANEYGMEAEFIQWMFQILKVNDEQVGRACNGALMEWDI